MKAQKYQTKLERELKIINGAKYPSFKSRSNKKIEMKRKEKMQKNYSRVI